MTAVQQAIPKQTKWVFVEESKFGDAGQAKEGFTRSRDVERRQALALALMELEKG